MTDRLRAAQIVESTWSNRRYQVVRRLGQGGFGTTYEVVELDARNKKLWAWCMKVTDDQGSWHREAYFGELLRGHDRAIQIEESFAISHNRRAGRSADYYLVAEYAELGSLDNYLRSDWKVWSAAQVRREAIGILRLLAALHDGGVTHRDLTPGNILVTENKRLKVGDWGIARTARGEVLAALDGQNWWFTPQNFRGRKRDDTWMIGQLMAMLLAGDPRRPFDTVYALDGCSDPHLAQVIARAIGPAAGRYIDASEMLADLDGRPRSGPLRTLRNKRVCFSGPLDNATREEARRQLETAGGIFQLKVGPGTDVLVRGSQSPLWLHGSRGKKLVMSELYGVQVIPEQEFWNLVARSRKSSRSAR